MAFQYGGLLLHNERHLSLCESLPQHANDLQHLRQINSPQLEIRTFACAPHLSSLNVITVTATTAHPDSVLTFQKPPKTHIVTARCPNKDLFTLHFLCSPRPFATGAAESPNNLAVLGWMTLNFLVANYLSKDHSLSFRMQKKSTLRRQIIIFFLARVAVLVHFRHGRNPDDIYPYRRFRIVRVLVLHVCTMWCYFAGMMQ